MTNYKNINTSLTQMDYNYIESSHEYWLQYDKVYTNFIDFVDRVLINVVDMKILRFMASQDKNISNPTQFISNLKKSYLADVKKFCMDWGMQLQKPKGGIVNECKSKESSSTRNFKE